MGNYSRMVSGGDLADANPELVGSKAPYGMPLEMWSSVLPSAALDRAAFYAITVASEFHTGDSIKDASERFDVDIPDLIDHLNAIKAFEPPEPTLFADQS